MKVTRGPRFLLQEITREWDFEHNGEYHTLREYEGMEGRRMWFDDEEVYNMDEDILLDGMTAMDNYEEVYQYE